MAEKNVLRMLTIPISILAVSCGVSDASLSDPALKSAMSIEQTLAHPSRSNNDREKDEIRNPASIVRFADIKAGQALVEYEAGGGYFTEILSRVIGPDGKIQVVNPAKLKNFFGTKAQDRIEGKRLNNVELLETDFGGTGITSNQADIVTWISNACFRRVVSMGSCNTLIV